MLHNFQRYFRFYLAFFLVGVLYIGIRWEGDSIQNDAARPARPVAHPASLAAVGTVAAR